MHENDNTNALNKNKNIPSYIFLLPSTKSVYLHELTSPRDCHYKNNSAINYNKFTVISLEACEIKPNTPHKGELILSYTLLFSEYR